MGQINSSYLQDAECASASIDRGRRSAVCNRPFPKRPLILIPVAVEDFDDEARELSLSFNACTSKPIMR